MTDAEAIQKLMVMRVRLDDSFAPALEHLATALADRAALVEAANESGAALLRASRLRNTLNAARRHMEGK